MKLQAEESLLLLTCRPYLTEAENERIRRIVQTGPVDWPYVVWRSEAYRTTSLLWYHIQRLELEEAIPGEIRGYLKAWKTLCEAQLLAFYRELGTIVSAFGTVGIDCFITKGAALGPRYYPSPLVRSMQDLDLMIHPHDAQLAQNTMLDLGYQHGLWNPGTNTIKREHYRITPESLAHYHELPSFTKCVRMRSPLPKTHVPWAWRRKFIKCFIDKEGILTMPVFVDIHVNVSEGIDLADVWRGAQREEVLGTLVKVHSPTGMLWFIASRLYHEVFQYATLKLIMFGDTQAIIHERKEDIDWSELVTIAKKYGMNPGLYYVLAQLKRLTGAEIPDPVLKFLQPDSRGIPSQHDWGDIMPKILSVPVLEDVVLA